MHLFLTNITQKKLHDRNFQFPILCDQSIPPNDRLKKLLSTFYDKKNYTLSLHMLKYCLEKGLKLKKYTIQNILSNLIL